MDRMMDARAELALRVAPQALLGYLNFSDGRPDAKFQKAFNEAFTHLAEQGESRPWLALHDWLLDQAKQLQSSGSAAFKEITQATSVVRLSLKLFLERYRTHHLDLLGHQPEAILFTPFFLTRICEGILLQTGPWDEEERILKGALNFLNDYVGHRPVAILEPRPQTILYPHEKLRPVPIYLRGVGACSSVYQPIVEEAIRILESTEPHLLLAAEYDISRMDELAFDPRAYDHSHPVNRRPNYLYGEWDPHHIVNGNYRRFVVRQNVLDALLEASKLTRKLPSGPMNRLNEAAAVLAGTILMASGISGGSPTSHDSDTKLANLIPRIARYRDLFYQQLIEKISGELGEELREEAKRIRQPFGGIRQQLNHELARQRAFQLQEGHLSVLFAELGYPNASRERASRIPAASVRIQSEIRLRQTSAEVLLLRKDRSGAAKLLPEIESLIERGIDCGALADPWNILGYQGLYPLFQSREDSVQDTRNDELIEIVSRQFDLYAQLLASAASARDGAQLMTLTRGVHRLAEWWDKYATYEVNDVPRLKGEERADAALHVGKALAQWSEKFGDGGTSPGSELSFWRDYREEFTSASAFAQVVEALLQQKQWNASLSLLVAWLAESDTISLEENEASFHELILRWLEGVIALEDASTRTNLIQKCMDQLEVSGESLWSVPDLSASFDSEEDSGEEYASAYEGMVFRDSADDGNEGSTLGNEPIDAFSLEAESNRLEQRLQFLETIAELWQRCLAGGFARGGMKSSANWLVTARTWQQDLLQLMDHLHELPVPTPGTGVDEVIEFDRRQHIKDHLLDTTISTTIEVAQAVRVLVAMSDQGEDSFESTWEWPAVRVERAVARKDMEQARLELPRLIKELSHEQSLFVPLSDGGQPRQIFSARSILMLLSDLLEKLPRLGLIREGYQLLRMAKSMEQNGPAEGRKVSEFDRLFKISLRATVDTLLVQAQRWDREATEKQQDRNEVTSQFAKVLSTISNEFLRIWVEHSNTLRLAAVEGIGDNREWQTFRDFIKNYGRQLFTAEFMAFGNLRGILHQGVGNWLDSLTERGDENRPEKLLEDLEKRKLSRQRVIHYLETLMMAIAENYEEYRDYNTTTTQSDYGDNLYVLMEFLRLKVQYDRYAWRMKPLVLAHEVLCRRNQMEIAKSWVERISEESVELSETLLAELVKLEGLHAIRLRTIRDRLEERFLHPLQVDRLCALVEPVARGARAGETEEGENFKRLEAELKPLADNPTGVGLDAPVWIRRLETEVDRVRESLQTGQERLPKVMTEFSLADLQRQIADWKEE
jgi:hypothetical protein